MRSNSVNPVRNSSGPSPRRPAATVREHGGSGSGHAGGALKPAAESFDPEALDGQRSIISNGVNNSYRESESIYKKLVEASLQGIVIAQGIPPRLIYANPAISRILGYSPDELTSLTPKQIQNLIHPDDRLKFFNQYKTLFEGKSIRPSYEIRAIRKDGSTVWLELSAVQIEYNGEPAVLATYVDITERKRAEEALQIRGEFEKLIMTISTNFINLTLADIDEEITRTLQKIGEFAGVDRSYVFLFSEEGERMSNTHEWCAPEIKPQIQRLQRIMMDQELPYFARIIKNRKVFYVPRVADLPEEAKAEKKEFELENIQSLICVPIIHRDTLAGFLGFDSVRKEKSWSEDVIVLLKIVGEMIGNAIGRKRVEEALRESEERYRTILENIEDGYFEVDLAGNFTFFNDSLCRMLGYSRDEIMGMNNQQYTDPENANNLFQAFNRVFRTGDPSKIFGWKIIRKDGTKRYVETSVSLIK